MPLTFYTVLVDQKGYPVKYCQPKDGNATSYGNVQTFAKKDYPFGDPAEACNEFEAWLGPHVETCYLAPAQFQAKVRALHQLRQNTKNKLQAWSAMSAK